MSRVLGIHWDVYVWYPQDKLYLLTFLHVFIYLPAMLRECFYVGQVGSRPTQIILFWFPESWITGVCHHSCCWFWFLWKT